MGRFNFERNLDPLYTYENAPRMEKRKSGVKMKKDNMATSHLLPGYIPKWTENADAMLSKITPKRTKSSFHRWAP